jgi:hypothetical protein
MTHTRQTHEARNRHAYDAYDIYTPFPLTLHFSCCAHTGVASARGEAHPIHDGEDQHELLRPKAGLISVDRE